MIHPLPKVKIRIPSDMTEYNAWPMEMRGKDYEAEVTNVRLSDGTHWGIDQGSFRVLILQEVMAMPAGPEPAKEPEEMPCIADFFGQPLKRLEVEFK